MSGFADKMGRVRERSARQRSQRRLAAVLVALSAAAVLAMPGAAGAATQVTFNVRDEAGRLQANVGFYDSPDPDGSGFFGRTDSDGTIARSLDPGATIYFNRDGNDNNSPEGWPGRSYTVPASPPSEVNLTLPTALTADVPTVTSHDGRWIAGAINGLRQTKGLPPLEISTTLNAVAANTSPYSTWPLAIDSGWLAPAEVKRFASADHNDAGWDETITDFVGLSRLERLARDPEYKAVGVAHVKRSYVAVFGGACSEEPRCGMTTDTGVAPAYLRADSGGAFAPSPAPVSVSPPGQVVSGEAGPGQCPPRGCPLLGYDKGTEVTLTANTRADTRVAAWYVGDQPLPTSKQCIAQSQCTLTLSSDTYAEAYLAPVHRLRLGLRWAKRRHNRVKLMYQLSKVGARGQVRASATLGGRHRPVRARRQLHVHRRGRRVIVKGKLRSGNWHVYTRFVGRGTWPRRGVAAQATIHAYGTPSSWTRMRVDRD